MQINKPIIINELYTLLTCGVVPGVQNVKILVLIIKLEKV
jgi:hypothetical protein